MPADRAKAAGCEYLHMDFEDGLRPVLFWRPAGRTTNAGLLSLS